MFQASGHEMGYVFVDNQGLMCATCDHSVSGCARNWFCLRSGIVSCDEELVSKSRSVMRAEDKRVKPGSES